MFTDIFKASPNCSLISFMSLFRGNHCLEFGVSHCMHIRIFSLGMYVSISNITAFIWHTFNLYMYATLDWHFFPWFCQYCF